MVLISIGEMEIDTEDYSDGIREAVESLLRKIKEEEQPSMGCVIVCDGSIKEREILNSALFGHHWDELNPIKAEQERFQIFRDNVARDIIKMSENYDYRDPDKDSYHPKHGVFCKFLWVDPKEIHDLLCVLIGFTTVQFYRKCFMQLKRFVNLGFNK